MDEANESRPSGKRVAIASRLDSAIIVIASGLGLGYMLALVILCATHVLMFDSDGHPLVTDFMVFQAAGDLALQGKALLAYTPAGIHAQEVIRAGHGFPSGVFPWGYPPLFLFVASALALFPFTTAFALWIGTTVPLYAAISATITRRREVFLAACGTPWAILATMNGQNGFLTASIIGLVLVNLEQRPAIAGILLGLLSYKPQFALLFPFAFAFGGYWRAFAWACIGTIAWTVLSGFVFGSGCLVAFVHALGHATQDVLVVTGVGWNKLQSLYGLLRWVGLPGTFAWAAQFSLSIACVLFVADLWRGRGSFALKAAGLVAVVPLATPYVFIYDLPLLTLAWCFLYRQRGFDVAERVTLAIAVAGVASFFWHAYPAGLFVGLGVVSVILRRRYIEKRGMHPEDTVFAAKTPTRSAQPWPGEASPHPV